MSMMTTPPDGLTAALVDAEIRALTRMLGTIRPEKLAQAVELLARSEAIHVIGQGRAFAVATHMAGALWARSAPAYGCSPALVA